MISEVSREVLDFLIAEGLSPPLCIGRLQVRGFDRWFIGLVSEAMMDTYLRRMYT